MIQLRDNDIILNRNNLDICVNFIDKELHDFINRNDDADNNKKIIRIFTIISLYFQSKWENPERYIGINIHDSTLKIFNQNENSNNVNLLEVVIKYLPSIMLKFDSKISSSSTKATISMQSIYFYNRFIHHTFKEMVNNNHIIEGIIEYNIHIYCHYHSDY
jgi:hypothetical protein